LYIISKAMLKYLWRNYGTPIFHVANLWDTNEKLQFTIHKFATFSKRYYKILYGFLMMKFSLQNLDRYSFILRPFAAFYTSIVTLIWTLQIRDASVHAWQNHRVLKQNNLAFVFTILFLSDITKTWMLYTCTILTFSSFCQYFHQSAEANNDDTRGFSITYGEYMRTC